MIPNTKNARFYFANLGADVMRCVVAIKEEDEDKYANSLDRAHSTLALLETTDAPGAHEEGKLLLEALRCAKNYKRMDEFSQNLNKTVAPLLTL